MYIGGEVGIKHRILNILLQKFTGDYDLWGVGSK